MKKKKLVSHKIHYIGKRKKLFSVKFVFDDDIAIGFMFIPERLCKVENKNSSIIRDTLAKGIDKSLKYLKRIVDNESYIIIESILTLKLSEYL